MSITYWISMIRKRLLLGSTIVLGLLLFGSLLLMQVWGNPNFRELEKKEVVLDTYLTVPANEQRYATASLFIPADPESALYDVSFNCSEGTVDCFFADVVRWRMWQDEEYEPDWYTAEHGVFGISASSGTAEEIDHYFVCVNNDSYEKEVYLQITKTCYEANYLGMFGGIALIGVGTVVGIGLKIRGKNKA
jgi:hypothetical protein